MGLEDGTVSLYDVENEELLRGLKSHAVVVLCLDQEEDAQVDKVCIFQLKGLWKTFEIIKGLGARCFLNFSKL